jgi:hypothetical protein
MVFVLLVVGAGAAGVYISDQLYFKPLREQRELIRNLKSLVERLTKDERLAEVAILDQTPERTKISFTEVDAQGKPIGEPRVVDVIGSEVYFDTLVIKFEDNFIPIDEALLKHPEITQQLVKKSIILFRRIFSDKQRPEDGFPLDAQGDSPTVYAGKKAPSKAERELWANFWKLATDPELAKEHGVRAAHGQAVSMRLEKGKKYFIESRATGELTIRPGILK